MKKKTDDTRRIVSCDKKKNANVERNEIGLHREKNWGSEHNRRWDIMCAEGRNLAIFEKIGPVLDWIAKKKMHKE